MLRVTAGHYRDVFMHHAYDVFRDRTVDGPKIAVGWRYSIHGDREWSYKMYDTKSNAERAARSIINERYKVTNDL